MAFERHYSALITASLITVAAFVASSAYTQHQLNRLDTLSSTIETNAVPSVDDLSRAARRLTKLNQLMDDVSTPGPQHVAALAPARQELASLQEDVEGYLRLPPLPGERAFWARLRDDVDRAAGVTTAALDEASRTGAPVPLETNARVDDALDRAVRSVVATLQFDISQSESMARDVRDVRVATRRTVILLDGGSTLLALVALFFAYRASRRHDRLLEAHTALLMDRAAELDRFAGRVAHDVLSPLGTISVGLALLGRSADAGGQACIDRSQRALQGVQQLVEDLLLFARSGARPDPAAACAAAPAIRGAVADCSDAAAEKQIELALDLGDLPQVACTSGVIASIVQNLVRNAIKYMASSRERRVTVRARATGAMVRIEVVDSGPGIPVGMQARIFDRFVRGEHETESGTGLGLATVKRLVESHGGRVGLQSTPGEGSCFCVDLPVAAQVADTSPALVHHA